MRILPKFLAISSILFVTLPVYAIEVSVQANTKVEAIGFTVDGNKHGGTGSSYHASDLPKGVYSFGLHADAKDIGCVDKRGRKMFKITQNTHAVVNFQDGRCTVSLGSR